MPQHHDDPIIALHEEQISVTKQDVVSDRVRVTTSVEERAVLIEEEVERGALQIERVPRDQPVQSVPEPRHEGDTLIVSIVEERMVVEKRLFVIEELRITHTSTTQRVAIPDTVRVMRANVERTDPASPTRRDNDG